MRKPHYQMLVGSNPTGYVAFYLLHLNLSTFKVGPIQKSNKTYFKIPSEVSELEKNGQKEF